MNPGEIDLLSKLGAFGPGFLLAAFMFLHTRRERDKWEKDRQDERLLWEKWREEERKAIEDERQQDREMMHVLYQEVKDTVQANTRALTAMEATTAALARAIENSNLPPRRANARHG